MRVNKFFATGFAALLAMGISTANADVAVFDIGNDEAEVTAAELAIGDPAGAPFLTSDPSADTNTIVTLTVTDITAFDSDDQATAVLTSGAGTGHAGNIANGSFGINGAGSGGFNSEATNFGTGESFTFTFDENISFATIDLQSFDSTAETNGLRISSAGFDDFEITLANLPLDEDGVPQDATGFDFVFPEDQLIVAAGTEVTFEAFSSDGLFNASNSFRIQDFSVNVIEVIAVDPTDPATVPEPSSLALLGLLGGVAAIRRRR